MTEEYEIDEAIAARYRKDWRLRRLFPEKQPEVSDLNRLPQWAHGPLHTERGEFLPIFLDDDGQIYETVEPGSWEDPFTILHSDDHYAQLRYFLTLVAYALRDGDTKRAEKMRLFAERQASYLDARTDYPG